MRGRYGHSMLVVVSLHCGLISLGGSVVINWMCVTVLPFMDRLR